MWLKKYTKLYYLEAILTERKLFLGDPANWPDKNDLFCIEVHNQANGIESTRVACLNNGPDRYHFWHVYGDCADGVCLWFDRCALEKDIESDGTLKSGFVVYKGKKSATSVKKGLVPFVKRAQYTDEREFRVLREVSVLKLDQDKFSFSPLSLKRVYLNPWLDSAKVSHWKSQIKRWQQDGLEHVEVLQNESLSSDKWKQAISGAMGLKADV